MSALDQMTAEEVTAIFESSPFYPTEGFLITHKGLYFRKAFEMRDTDGLPLAVLLDRLQGYATACRRPINPGLVDFVEKAVAAGWKRTSANATVLEALVDTIGPEPGRAAFDRLRTHGYWLVPRREARAA